MATNWGLRKSPSRSHSGLATVAPHFGTHPRQTELAVQDLNTENKSMHITFYNKADAPSRPSDNMAPYPRVVLPSSHRKGQKHPKDPTQTNSRSTSPNTLDAPPPPPFTIASKKKWTFSKMIVDAHRFCCTAKLIPRIDPPAGPGQK